MYWEEELKQPKQDFLVACYLKARTVARELCQCRQCGGHCKLLCSICEHCGAQDPVRLPFVWLCCTALLVVALGAAGMWLL